MQQLDRILEATLEILLPQISFGLMLFMQQLQLLRFSLFCFELHDFGYPTVDLCLEQGIVSSEAVHLSLRR
jgi:hypothetical protein